jgi:1-acyl-sn-glycerol-3-phosphate acyltransferase
MSAQPTPQPPQSTPQPSVPAPQPSRAAVRPASGRREGQELRPVYETVRFLARPIVALVCRLRTEGLANIPASGPVILAMNHIHWTDIPLASIRVPRVTHYMSKIENFQAPILGQILRWCGTFPVRRGEGDREALRTAERLLHDGQIIVIFPEGHRSGTGVLLPAHPGAAYIALRTGAPIVPVAITGTQRVFKSFRLGPWAPRVTIRYGPPFQLAAAGANSRRGRDALAQATDQIMREIAALLPPEQRGPYAGRSGASPLPQPADPPT